VTYTWTGTFSAPASDTYYLYLRGSIAGAAGPFGGSAPLTITIDGSAPTSFTPAVPVSTYPAGIIPPGGSNTGFIATLGGGTAKREAHLRRDFCWDLPIRAGSSQSLGQLAQSRLRLRIILSA